MLKIRMSPILTRQDTTLLMSVLVVGYMMITYVRESVTYAAPVIANAEHMESKDLGLIVSSQKLGYTLVKFLGGTLVDVLDPGFVFTLSLILSGVVGTGFAACSSVRMFSLMWFLCGVVQGPAWPACALLMKNSFLVNQLATWWSILSASSNLAGSLGPMVSQSLNSVYPWRVAFLLAGLVSVTVGILAGFFLYNFQKTKMSIKDQTEDKRPKERQRLALGALMNPVMLSVCFVYFLHSVVRGACADWSQHYLIHDKDQSLITGSRIMSCQEVGGIVGSITAGYLSDASMPKPQHRAMPRVRIQLLFSTLQTFSLFCLIFLVKAHSSQVWISTVSFVIGFSLYGCISLVGIVAMEVAPDNLAGTAQSLATLAANVGRVIAGYPLTLIATYYSWHESFLATLLVSLMSVAGTFILLQLLTQLKQDHQQVFQKQS